MFIACDKAGSKGYWKYKLARKTLIRRVLMKFRKARFMPGLTLYQPTKRFITP